MKALSGGGKVVVAGAQDGQAEFRSKFKKKIDTAEITQEGTQNIIIGQLDAQEVGNPNPDTWRRGQKRGLCRWRVHSDVIDDNDDPVGSLANCHCTEIVITYDKETKTFSGAKFVLYADQGGGMKIEFEPYETDISDDNQLNLKSMTNYPPMTSR